MMPWKPWAPNYSQDPVCGATLDEKTTGLKIEYEGITFLFCSSKCMEAFMANPSTYVKKKTQRPSPP